MSRIAIHAAPDKDAIAKNVAKEPEGERIRAELAAFLKRNNIVSIMLDTDEHCVSVDIVKLPPDIKPVLTLWGSIYVRDAPVDAQVKMSNSCNRHSDCEVAIQEYLVKYPNKKRHEIPFGFHCHDEDCEDCFGC